MRVIAGIDVDAGVGPSIASAVGEVAASPAALLGILESLLGLRGPEVSAAERAAWLLPRLHATEGYWSPSASTDEWGTAVRLVRDRDALVLEGWQGEPVSSRWDALWRVTEGMPPGVGDRWCAVANAMGDRAIDLSELQLVDPRAEWPGAIRRVFARLERQGIDVRNAVLADAPASGDLAAARAIPFRPGVDGSLQLARAQGPAAAAEDVAAWLAERDDLGATMVITPDATLDAALHRAGLPTTGAASAAAGARATALQVLPLCLELMWEPADPQLALELLCLPSSPIPRRLARRLAAALREWPAVGSEPWNAALAEHDYGADPAAVTRRKHRVHTLLSPNVPRDCDAIPTAILRARIETAAAWIRARIHTDLSTDGSPWARAWVQHRGLLRLLNAIGRDEIAAPLLARLLDAATEMATVATPFEARAGIRTVASPGAVIRPADTIVWWAFTRDAAPHVRPLGLTKAERSALAAASIEIPSAGDRASWLARRWRRPLLMARRHLLLIAPRASAPGERLHPHPLWDEIVAAIPAAERERLAAALQTPRPAFGSAREATRTRTNATRLPEYRAQWDVPAGSLVRREKESPTELATLVGCSLRWALQYRLDLSEATATYRLGVGPRELGSIAHEVLAQVLRSTPMEPRAAAGRAATVFDELGPRRIAPLFLPGRDAEREQARLAIVRSAEALVDWLVTQRLSVECVEEMLERELDGRVVRGRVDLLAGPPRVVVDIKWGGRKDKRETLVNGTAHQLATYAFAASREGEVVPEYAYFIALDQSMLGRRGGPFGEHTTIDGPTPSQTWDRFRVAFRERFEEVARGCLSAPGGTGDAPERPIVVGDRLALPTGCEWCSYDALCGLAFHEDEA